MDKFLKHDETLGIYRLPLTFSLGNLDRIRELFGEHSVDASIALPKLPPHRDVIDSDGTLGYLVYPPKMLSAKINEFIEGTVVHVRELKSKGYDYQHPLFKNYLKTREDCLGYLAGYLETVVSQERRLGIFNLFWLAVTKQCIQSMDEILAKSAASQKMRFLLHPHLKSLLNQVLEHVYEKLAIQDNATRQNIPFYRDTLKSKLGGNFNFNFVKGILNVQLSLLESSMPPLDPLFQIRKLLVEDNAEYYISYKDFYAFYENIYSWIEEKINQSEEWLLFLVSNILGLPVEKIPKLNINTIIFDPNIIFTIQESLKQMPVKLSSKGFSLRKHKLVDEFGERIWNQLMLDYIKLARELQKAEVIGYFRDHVIILGPEYQRFDENGEALDGLDNRITYNFNSLHIVSDLRKMTLIFIDLRGFTEISTGLISTHQLKEALYAFFDPALDIIDHFRGQIRFFAGDSILATFRDHGDENQRSLNAIRVGVSIQRMLRHLVSQNKFPFQGVGVGIHVGQTDDAYIFKNRQDKIDTIIGLPANISSRLSSGKSTFAERKGDPLLLRSLMDSMQDVVEQIKGKIPQTTFNGIVSILKQQIAKYSGESTEGSLYMQLPEMKSQPGQFKVSVVGGILNNNGIVLSEDCFNELKAQCDLRSRPRGDEIEFVFSDPVLEEDLIFFRAGHAALKGLERSMPVWAVYPSKG